MSRPSSKKKTGIIIGAIVWVLLMGGAVALALLNKPEPEIVHTDEIAEAYKYTDGRTVITDTVDDLDYYGTYRPNQIEVIKVKGLYQISGLKDKAVEEKINSRIEAVASELNDIYPERGVTMTIGANYFNLFSIHMVQYTPETYNEIEKSLTFDLNTGNELSFDDLFPDGVNYASLFFNSTYNELATSIQFEKKDVKRKLEAVKWCPDPLNCSVMGSRITETPEQLAAHIADLDEQLVNLEDVTLQTIREYLAGNKDFYLKSHGPVLIITDNRRSGTELNDNRHIEVELKDNIRYATYLKKYRSKESLFENDSIDDSVLLFTETPDYYTRFHNVETDNYFVDAVINMPVQIDVKDFPAQQVRKTLIEYASKKGLSIGDSSKQFHYINVTVNDFCGENLLSGSTEIVVYSMDKAYFDTTFRRAVVDGKTQLVTISANQPPRAGEYDEKKVVVNAADNIYGNGFVLTKSGKILDNIDDIITVKPSEYDWRKELLNMAYMDSCEYAKECYTEEQKRSHKIRYGLGSSTIYILKSEDNGKEFVILRSYSLEVVPIQYLNPEVVINDQTRSIEP